MQPTAKHAGDGWHDHPSQKSHHTRVEESVAEDEIPGPNRRTEGKVQDHRDGKDSQKSGDRHLPSWWRIVRSTKPRFESVQLATHRLAFGQRSGPLLPCLEHRRFIEGITLLPVVKRS